MSNGRQSSNRVPGRKCPSGGRGGCSPAVSEQPYLQRLAALARLCSPSSLAEVLRLMRHTQRQALVLSGDHRQTLKPLSIVISQDASLSCKLRPARLGLGLPLLDCKMQHRLPLHNPAWQARRRPETQLTQPSRRLTLLDYQRQDSQWILHSQAGQSPVQRCHQPVPQLCGTHVKGSCQLDQTSTQLQACIGTAD